MPINHGLLSSNSGEWATPQDFWEALDQEFHFTLDVAATSENAKCDHYYTQEMNGLGLPWAGRVWCNPPYGREIKHWVKRGYECGALVVMLVPARTDTAWWHDYVMKGEVRFIRGRLKFGGHTNSAPFPSAVVVFRP